jgi:hypothetical protein
MITSYFIDDGKASGDSVHRLGTCSVAPSTYGFWEKSEAHRPPPYSEVEWIRQRRATTDWEVADRSIAKVVKAHAVRVGLDPANFSGHSLRSGFLTSAAVLKASIFKMADQSRRSMDTLRGSVRDAKIFKDHAGAACCKNDGSWSPDSGTSPRRRRSEGSAAR